MSRPLTRFAGRLSLAVLLGAGAGAAAAAPFGTLEFIEPTGVVLPTDNIPVWLRFTLDSERPPVIGSSSDVSRLDPLYFPDFFRVLDGPFGGDVGSFSLSDPGVVFQPTSAGANVFFTCATSFTALCGEGPPYDFSFDSGPSSITPFNHEFEFRPDAEPLDLLLGTFSPTGGSAPFGQYFFYGAGLFLDVRGSATITRTALDEFGSPIQALQRYEGGELVLDGLGSPIPLFQRYEGGELVRDGDGNPIPLFQQDEFGELVLDGLGNPIPLFQSREPGELVLDEFNQPIPLFQRDTNGDLVLDGNGEPIPLFQTDVIFHEFVSGWMNIATTPCANGPFNPSCEGNFSRVVVPLPAAAWLFVSALSGGMLLSRRRRRTEVVTNA